MEALPAAINERRRVKRGARNGVPPQMDVPTFGDWEFLHHDQIPITQYFDFHHHHPHTPPRASLYPPYPTYFSAADAMFLHYDDFQQQQQHYRPCLFPTPIVDSVINLQGGSGTQVKGECGTRRRRTRRQQRRSCLENKNRVFDFDTTETFTTPNSVTEFSNDAVRCHANIKKSTSVSKSKNNVKAKDEDLYKIPPELLRRANPKRKMSKFFTKCFVTICASH